MSPASVIISVVCALCFLQVDTAPRQQRGRILEVSDTEATIAVKAGQEPPAGTKIEVYIEVPELEGIAILATGRVTSVKDGVVTATLESKTGRIEKNHMVRFVAARTDGRSAKPVGTASELIGSAAGLKSSPLPRPSTPAVGSSKPESASDDFSAVVAKNQRALMIIGEPGRGHGTGFVISKQLRLVATNAHVADIAKIAMLNDTRTSYKVSKRWYHPGVLRTMDDGRTRLQSSDPAEGDVYPNSADLAILQLEAGGPDLPVQVTLASPDEVQKIVGTNVGVCGFPGSEFDRQLKPDQIFSASFVPGTISRLTGLGDNSEAPLVQRQLVHLEVNSYSGLSGSPVFLKNGHVAAVLNSNQPREDAEDGSSGAGGLRVDALWELIDRQRFTLDVSGDSTGLRPLGTLKLPVDPQVAKLRNAYKLIAESAELLQHDEFKEADDRLKAAMALSPNYWRLSWQAAKNLNHQALDEWDTMSKAEKLTYGRKSLQHLQTAVAQFREAFGGVSTRLTLELVREKINVGRLSGDSRNYESAIEILSDPRFLQNAGKDRDYVLALRGSAKYDNNDFAGALQDLNEAIRLDPKQKNYYNSRSYVWAKLGRTENATADKNYFKHLLHEEHHHHHH